MILGGRSWHTLPPNIATALADQLPPSYEARKLLQQS